MWVSVFRFGALLTTAAPSLIFNGKDSEGVRDKHSLFTTVI